MKHAHSADVDINVDIPAQDLEDLIDHVTAAAVVVIGFYMAADTVRSIIKSTLK